MARKTKTVGQNNAQTSSRSARRRRNWLILAVCAVMALCVFGWARLARPVVGGEAWANEKMDEAVKLNPHLAGITDLYVGEVGDYGSDGNLDMFSRHWGVVLKDGTVVLSENGGEIYVDDRYPDIPMGVRFLPCSTNAVILTGVKVLPEWIGKTILTARTHADAPCIVGIAESDRDGGVIVAAMYAWDGDEYVDAREIYFPDGIVPDVGSSMV